MYLATVFFSISLLLIVLNKKAFAEKYKVNTQNIGKFIRKPQKGALIRLFSWYKIVIRVKINM
jgi:preprotein translocase subunit SecG